MGRSDITAAADPAINTVLAAVRQAADVVCDRWSLSLVLAAFSGERRFAGFAGRTGMASRLVTSRLKALEDQGILVREPYSQRPLRHDYLLSAMGREMAAIFAQMQRWEDNCNRTAQTPLVCAHCLAPATARDIDLRLSHALMRQLPAKQTARRRTSLVPGSNDLNRPLARSLEIFGDKWSIEILICAFLGQRRFTDIRSHTGIAANVLTGRLTLLTGAGLLRRTGDGAYRLTESGIDLYGVLVAIQDWADAWLGGRVRSPIRLVHRNCGAIFHVAPAGPTMTFLYKPV